MYWQWCQSGYTDKELHEITLEMQEITLKHQFLLHLIHVSGSRLICCGVDGLSCGNLQLEKLDEEIYLHLPANHDQVSRSPTILTWIQSWISDPFLSAEPSDWFSRYQQTYYTSIRS